MDTESLVFVGMAGTNERVLPFQPGNLTPLPGGRFSVETPYSQVISLRFILGPGFAAVPGQEGMEDCKRRLAEVKARFLKESVTVANWRRLEAQSAELKKELAGLERKPAELESRIRRLLVEGQPVEQLEVECDQATVRLGKLKERVKIMEGALAGARRVAASDLYQAIDCERERIEGEATDRARQLAQELSRSIAANLETLRAVNAVAAYLGKQPGFSGGERAEQSVTDELAVLE